MRERWEWADWDATGLFSTVAISHVQTIRVTDQKSPLWLHLRIDTSHGNGRTSPSDASVSIVNFTYCKIRLRPVAKRRLMNHPGTTGYVAKGPKLVRICPFYRTNRSAEIFLLGNICSFTSMTDLMQPSIHHTPASLAHHRKQIAPHVRRMHPSHPAASPSRRPSAIRTGANPEHAHVHAATSHANSLPGYNAGTRFATSNYRWQKKWTVANCNQLSLDSNTSHELP